MDQTSAMRPSYPLSASTCGGHHMGRQFTDGIASTDGFELPTEWTQARVSKVGDRRLSIDLHPSFPPLTLPKEAMLCGSGTNSREIWPSIQQRMVPDTFRSSRVCPLEPLEARRSIR